MPLEDYDPTSTHEASITDLLRVTAPLLRKCSYPMDGMWGHLLGLPPTNIVYQLHKPTLRQMNTGLGFVLQCTHDTLGVPFNQQVECTTSSPLHFEAFVLTVLQPALHYSNMGDTGVRIALSWATGNDGRLEVMAGCNLPGLACVVYTLRFTKLT